MKKNLKILRKERIHSTIIPSKTDYSNENFKINLNRYIDPQKRKINK